MRVRPTLVCSADVVFGLFAPIKSSKAESGTYRVPSSLTHL